MTTFNIWLELDHIQQHCTRVEKNIKYVMNYVVNKSCVIKLEILFGCIRKCKFRIFNKKSRRSQQLIPKTKHIKFLIFCNLVFFVEFTTVDSKNWKMLRLIFYGLVFFCGKYATKILSNYTEECKLFHDITI